MRLIPSINHARDAADDKHSIAFIASMSLVSLGMLTAIALLVALIYALVSLRFGLQCNDRQTFQRVGSARTDWLEHPVT